MTTAPLIWRNNSNGILQFQNNGSRDVDFVVSAPDPSPDYDVQGAVDILFPGLVIQRSLRDAAEQYYILVGRPLVPEDVPAILALANELNAEQELAGYVPSTQPDYPTSLPPYPTGLPRFPDTDGGMQSPDGWCITTDGKVVNI